MTMSGAVPPQVAGPQPPIDFEYNIALREDHGRVGFDIDAQHDAFPAHEIYVQAESGRRFHQHYEPTWFAPEAFGAGTVAKPSEANQLRGAASLGGFNRQAYGISGSL
jgi:hypothetical protein